MKRQLMQTLIIASFATMAINAGAQNATPRELPPGADPSAAAQNGTPADTPPAGIYQPGTSAYPSRGNSQDMSTGAINGQMREYMDARTACTSQPIAQRESCNNEVNGRFGAVDPKCQKLSGPALADCLLGADHGG